MANPALNAALIVAAQKQAVTTKAIIDQLTKVRATRPASAATLDLSLEGSAKMLDHLVKQGHIRAVGGGRYWLDEDALKRSKEKGVRMALILCAFLLSLGASLLVLANNL